MTEDSLPPPATSERQYRILIELGRGGTSDVYLAVVDGSGGFNKLVVLKALKPEIARDRAARRLFLSEARLSARLNHPNIVQVNEVIEQSGIPIIVMEYLEGRSLAEILERGRERLPLGLHLRVLSDALRGLHYSHDLCDYDGTPLRVVHRDMSPHNVLVTFEGQVKILDFGLAKVAGTADSQSGVLRGRLHYMAPDQLSEDRALDRRADVYAVGVMLWEAAAGQRLWNDVSEPVVMRRVLEGRLPRP
ncbi:MAG TPA: serine/threonine-protein kinase, partial [Polyangiaceae bacterium]|nr:serine/threonine-protein kinase [Polyangiaceae bacterium]